VAQDRRKLVMWVESRLSRGLYNCGALPISARHAVPGAASEHTPRVINGSVRPEGGELFAGPEQPPEMKRDPSAYIESTPQVSR